MARSALRFDDATQDALLNAARTADAAHPHDNPAFLDAFLHDAWQAARRVYGAQTYLRLMAQAGVTRRPSAGTVQKAIVRARTAFDGPPALWAAAGQQPPDLDTCWTCYFERNLARVLSMLDPVPACDGARLTTHGMVGPMPLSVVAPAPAGADERVQALERENRELRAKLAQMAMAAAKARQALGTTAVAGTIAITPVDVGISPAGFAAS